MIGGGVEQTTAYVSWSNPVLGTQKKGLITEPLFRYAKFEISSAGFV